MVEDEKEEKNLLRFAFSTFFLLTSTLLFSVQVALYGKMEDEDEGEDEIDKFVTADTDGNEEEEGNEDDDIDYDMNDDEGEEGEGEVFIEIDVEVVFGELSKGKSYVTFEGTYYLASKLFVIYYRPLSTFLIFLMIRTSLVLYCVVLSCLF